MLRRSLDACALPIDNQQLLDADVLPVGTPGDDEGAALFSVLDTLQLVLGHLLLGGLLRLLQLLLREQRAKATDENSHLRSNDP